MALGMVGVLSVVAIAPGLSKVLPLLSKVDIKRINQEIKRLQKRGLVKVVKKRNKIVEIKLTKEGKERLKRYQFETLEIEIPKRWDGKWRIVIFDVPINKNYSRQALRIKMKRLGFYKLQDSVFVHPYPCFEVVNYLRDFLGVSGEVEYLEVSNLESQDKLIGYFFG